MVLLASAIVWGAAVPTARALHFPFPNKDRAQGDVFYQQAFSAYESGDYAQAQSLIEKADQLKPDQPDGWNLRGMVFLKQNAFDKAEAAFARAVMLDPKLWAAQFNLAEAPFQGKDYARARPRFEKLLEQTDRFKQAREWELVQFKVFLSCLLMGDDAGAARKLSKLPATGGITPAYLYAQAALSFSRKDPATARRTLTAAQNSFSPLLNELFSNSLVSAGWQNPTPPPVLASSGPLPVAMPQGPMPLDSHTPIVIDPKLEAAVAEPLPSPDAGVHPVSPKVSPLPPRPAPKTVAAAAAPRPTAAPSPPPDAEADHRGLLLE